MIATATPLQAGEFRHVIRARLVLLVVSSLVAGIAGFEMFETSEPILGALALGALVVSLWLAWYIGRRAETAYAQLADREARFRSLAELSSDWYWEQDANFRFTVMSGGLVNKGNFAVKKALGKTRWELPIELGESEWAAHRATLEAHRAFTDFEYRIVTDDGSIRCFSARGEPIFDDRGLFEGYRGTANDITGRKQAEEALAQFKLTLDQTLDSVFMFREDDFRFIYVNDGAKRQVGYTEAELLRMTPLDIKPEFTLERFRQMVQPLLDGTQASLIFETVHRHKDGHDFPVEIFLQLLRSEGRSPRFVAIVRDITERKRADRLLRQITEGTASTTGEEFMRTLTRTLAEALGVRYAFVGEFAGPARDRVRLISLWNGLEHAEPFEYPLAGTPSEVVAGQAECFCQSGIQDLFPQDDYLVRYGVNSYLGIRLQSSKGEPLGLLTVMHTRKLGNEALARSVMHIFAARASAELERLQSTEALKRSEQRFAKAFRSSPLAVVLTRLTDGKVLDANEAAGELVGRTRQEMLGRTTLELGFWVDASDRERAVKGLRRTGSVRGSEHLARRKSGETRVVQDWLERIELEGESCIVGSLLDVTEVRKASEALRASEEQMRLITENMPAAVAYVDRDLVIQVANQRYVELRSAPGEEVIGRHVRDVAGEKDWPELAKKIARVFAGESVDYERTLERPDGERREIEVHFKPDRAAGGEVRGYYAFILDITERKRARDALHESEEELRLIANNVPAMICYFDTDYRYRYANRSYADFYGDGRPIEGRTVAEFVSEETWQTVRPYIDRALAGETVEYTRIHHRRSGKTRAVEATMIPQRDVSGRVLGVYSLVLDVSRRRRSEEALRLRNRAVEASVNSIMITEPTKNGQKIVYVNPAFERTTGYSAVEVIGKSPSFLHGEDRDQPGIEALRGIVREERETSALLRNYRKDGTLFWNELRVAPVRDETGCVTHFIGVSSDVTERIAYQAELERQANFDSLTGLANRNLLADRLRQAIVRAQRAERLGAVLFLDLDRFKVINDSLGHAMGDRVLTQVSWRLSEAVRGDDTVARTGGDEFVVVLADVAREEDVAIVAQKLLAVVASPVQIEGHEFLLSTSIGVAVFPRDGSDSDTLLKHADAALYRAKDRGRGGIAFFAQEMNDRAVKYFNLDRDLRHALERGEFVLHYQPIIAMASGEITGAEALIRWRLESGQMVSPMDFIPIAEESGLIVPIGAWVLREAAARAREWNADGRRELSVAVNLSARQFRDPNLVEMVRAALAETGLEPRLLHIEITESTVMHNAEEAIAALLALREIGVSLSVDDFGTGYSSLSYLKRLPLNHLKVDRSFVKDIPGDSDDVAITRAVIELAHSLELEVVAEGVETDEQRKFLLAQGCDYAQGYLFSKPIEEEAFRTLVKGRGNSAPNASPRPRSRARKR